MNSEEFGGGHGLVEIHAVFAWGRKTYRTNKILSVPVTKIQIEAINHGLRKTMPKCTVDNVTFY
jgi:S-adenosylmethionine synthetase